MTRAYVERRLAAIRAAVRAGDWMRAETLEAALHAELLEHLANAAHAGRRAAGQLQRWRELARTALSSREIWQE